MGIALGMMATGKRDDKNNQTVGCLAFCLSKNMDSRRVSNEDFPMNAEILLKLTRF